MSARNRNDEWVSDPKGRCYTPVALAEAIAIRVKGATDCKIEHIIEPSVGDGSFIPAISKMFSTACVTAVDPYTDSVYGSPGVETVRLRLEDYLESNDRNFDLAIGNPPFEVAAQHIERLLGRCKVVAMLLRLNWLGLSKNRRELLTRFPPVTVDVIYPRPGFERVMVHRVTGEERRFSGGSDATEYMLAMWGDVDSSIYPINYLTWKK